MIDSMNLGVGVTAFATDLFKADVINALSSCDILIGCMDSVDGRHLLNKIACYYVIPYIDMGVRIDADGKGGIDLVMGVVNTLQPGGSSLLSRGVYTQALLNEAFLARRSPETFAQRVKENYIKGARVNQPAVISLNMHIAAMAVDELLARIHPYRVDPNKHFAMRRVILNDPDAGMNEGDGNSCETFKNFVGLGDQQPLLGIPELNKL
jgi:ThiF family